MSATTDIPIGETIDLSKNVIGLERSSGKAVLVEQPGGPPRRIDGYTLGAPMVAGDPPHGGEMHPDADEVLFVISGRIQVVLELDDGARTVDVDAGHALVVPRGVWHNILSPEPAQIIHITPGPNGDARPKSRA
jgi:mannose-6-phosphate isomerase-like protein (cupin superfamily)